MNLFSLFQESFQIWRSWQDLQKSGPKRLFQIEECPKFNKHSIHGTKGERNGGYRKKHVDGRRKLALAVNFMTLNAKPIISARQRQGGISDQHATS